METRRTATGRRGIPAAMLVVLACGGAAGTATALPEDIERLADRGAEELYNMEFDRAAATYAELIREYPEHPAGPALMASAIWWQARFWYRVPDDAASEELTRWLDRAEAGARGMAASATPFNACEGRFFLGGVLGVRAHWHSLRREWLTAALAAREPVRILGGLATCTPYAEEAYFGLGLYEYAAASLPWSLRWLSRLVVGGGASTAGALAKLERAAGRGRWYRHDAMATLVTVCCIFERTPERALAPAEQLLRERPRSPLAHQLWAQALLFNRRWSETLGATDRALGWGRDPGSPFARETNAYRYLEGMALLGLKRPRDAEAAFAAAIQGAGRPAWIPAAAVRRGNALDLLGDRADALRCYQQARVRVDPWGQADRAGEWLARPYRWEDFDREMAP